MEDKDAGRVPPATISAPPERDLERKLKRDPKDPDLPAPTWEAINRWTRRTRPRQPTPGGSDEPAPSSSFPE